MRHSIKRHRKNNSHKKRRGHSISKMKYKCVKLRSKSKKHRGGATIPTTPIPAPATTASLPIVIDKNNVMYSCTAMPSS